MYEAYIIPGRTAGQLRDLAVTYNGASCDSPSFHHSRAMQRDEIESARAGDGILARVRTADVLTTA